MRDKSILNFENKIGSKKEMSGMAVIITKHIALEAAYILACEREKELSSYFAPDIVRNAKLFKNEMSVEKEKRIASEMSAAFTLPLSEGGLMTSLWKVACAFETGMDIDLKAVPVKQETIEICEYFSLNPYEIRSGGSLMIIARDERKICRALENAGIRSAIVGELNDSSDCILRHGDVRSYLNRPSPDKLSELLRRGTGGEECR